MICADETLNQADEEMTKALARAIAVNPQIQGIQDKWVADVRNKCTDAKCQTDAYLDQISVLEDASSTAKTQELKTQQAAAQAAVESAKQVETSAHQQAGNNVPQYQVGVARSEGVMPRTTQAGIDRSTQEEASHAANAAREAKFDSLPFYKRYMAYIAAFFALVLGGIIGFQFGNLMKPDMIFAENGMQLAGQRIKYSLAPYLLAIVGAAVSWFFTWDCLLTYFTN